MKNAIIIHGTDGVLEDHWQPWFKKCLEKANYQVFVPQFPDNSRPNYQKWSQIIKEQLPSFADGILVGHSAGTTVILRLLEEDWFPKVKAVVLVGTFVNEKLVVNQDWYDSEQFVHLLPKNSFDLAKIKAKCDHFYFVHGDNDPYCDYQDAKEFCQKLDGKLVTIKNGHHLGSERNLTELSEVIDLMKQDKVI